MRHDWKRAKNPTSRQNTPDLIFRQRSAILTASLRNAFGVLFVVLSRIAVCAHNEGIYIKGHYNSLGPIVA